MPFAWVSLDEQDNDPIRLWRHIVEALRRVVPEEESFGADVLVGMSAVGQQFFNIMLPTLINELAELPYQVVLVLDDYQFVTEEDSHRIGGLLRGAPPRELSTSSSPSRSDPPLPLGRLQSNGES